MEAKNDTQVTGHSVNLSRQHEIRSCRHPLVEDFLQQNPGCDEDAALRAFLVYQDLTEVRGWWFTQMSYSDPFERPYVVGQRTRLLPKEVVLPMGIEERISLHEAHEYFNDIFVNEEPIKSITLAVNDIDSTTVYYKLTSGLSPPDPPEVTMQRRAERNESQTRKRRHIAQCIRKASERLGKDF